MSRQHFALAVVITVVFAAHANAQSGRVQGVVRDVNGQPIRGAVIKATHPDAVPRELTAATDEDGRFAMIGLRVGTSWHFTTEAPGYYAVSVDAPVRSNVTLPLQFTLARDPGPIPGALVRDIQEQLTAANALRDQGRLDQAIAAYQAIQTRNSKLTSIGLVLGDTLRQRAATENNATARQTFLERAAASYQDVLKADTSNARAKTELEAVTADLKRLTP